MNLTEETLFTGEPLPYQQHGPYFGFLIQTSLEAYQVQGGFVPFISTLKQIHHFYNMDNSVEEFISEVKSQVKLNDTILNSLHHFSFEIVSESGEQYRGTEESVSSDPELKSKVRDIFSTAAAFLRSNIEDYLYMAIMSAGKKSRLNLYKRAIESSNKARLVSSAHLDHLDILVYRIS